MTTHEKDLPLYQLSDYELTTKIKSFCDKYPVIKLSQFKTLAGTEAAVSQIFNGSIFGFHLNNFSSHI